MLIIESVTSSECPMSISRRFPRLKNLVRIHTDSIKVSEKFGSPLGDSSKWSGSFYDATLVMLGERREFNEALKRLK